LIVYTLEVAKVVEAVAGAEEAAVADGAIKTTIEGTDGPGERPTPPSQVW
jgi:hypothetical protein